MHKFVGPCRVVKKIGRHTYRLTDTTGRQKRKGRAEFPIHVSQIKPYNDEFVSGNSPLASIDLEDVSNKEEKLEIGAVDVGKDETKGPDRFYQRL